LAKSIPGVGSSITFLLGSGRTRGQEGEIAKFGGIVDRHNGREGKVRLINGASEPEVTIAAGQIERWRIVNASSAS
jgi:hypothetical protein